MNKFKAFSKLMSDFFVDDLFQRYVILTTLASSLIIYYIWHYIIIPKEIFVYSAFGYYPIQVFSIIGVLHIVISLYGYNKDKLISYLLMSALLFYTILIMIIEIGYLIHS